MILDFAGAVNIFITSASLIKGKYVPIFHSVMDLQLLHVKYWSGLIFLIAPLYQKQ